jgi:hypothetical protein
MLKRFACLFLLYFYVLLNEGYADTLSPPTEMAGAALFGGAPPNDTSSVEILVASDIFDRVRMAFSAWLRPALSFGSGKRVILDLTHPLDSQVHKSVFFVEEKRPCLTLHLPDGTETVFRAFGKFYVKPLSSIFELCIYA